MRASVRHLALSIVILVGCGSTSPSARVAPIEPSVIATAPAPESYFVTLTRPRQVGERYRVRTVSATLEERVTSSEGEVIEHEREESHVRLTALVQVLAVNEQGRILGADYTIERCLVRDENRERELIPPGAVVRLLRGELDGRRGSFLLNGVPMAEQEADILSKAISLSVARIGDGEVFGTRDAHTVGAQWPMNVAAAGENLNSIPYLTVALDQISGRTSLDSLETVRGIASMRVSGELAAEGFQLTGLPTGSRTISSSMVARLRAVLPLDDSLARLSQGTDMNMVVQLEVPNPEGGVVLVDTNVQRSNDSEFQAIE